MYPHVRSSSDPYEGLEAQLTELIGLIKIVPPLISADRERRWEEIGARPGDPDEDMIDIYESEAGPEEGWGHADFGHTIHVAALVTAWENFREYLVRQLSASCLTYNLKGHPALGKLVAEERSDWSRQFPKLVKRYSDFLGVTLGDLSCWASVKHAQELRNALVHNLGQYTRKYLAVNSARRPTIEDLNGPPLPRNDDELIDHEMIPLATDFVESVIRALLKAAREIRDAVTRLGA